jgi:hypothetical protein
MVLHLAWAHLRKLEIGLAADSVPLALPAALRDLSLCAR